MWAGWGKQQKKKTDRGADRQSDTEALPHTLVVNVPSLIVSNSHSQMNYPIYIISNSSQPCPCYFHTPTGNKSSNDLICLFLTCCFCLCIWIVFQWFEAARRHHLVCASTELQIFHFCAKFFIYLFILWGKTTLDINILTKTTTDERHLVLLQERIRHLVYWQTRHLWNIQH